MAAGDPIPTNMPAMGGYFEKPYMEFEYRGELYRIDNLRGGHNGKVARACEARPPQWDEERQRWVVPVENNIIDIDLGENRPLNATFGVNSRFANMRVLTSARASYRSTGLLISSTGDRNQVPTFPVDCEFRMHIQVKVPGLPNLVNTRPFRLVATGIDQWPPAVGTRYRNLDTVELFPEFVPFYSLFFAPIVRIRSGDEAVLTEVFTR